MSRSYRHTSIIGMCGGKRASEKQDKRKANRGNRRINKTLMNTYNDNTILKEIRETSEIYSFQKDGKAYFNAKKWPKEMRK